MTLKKIVCLWVMMMMVFAVGGEVKANRSVSEKVFLQNTHSEFDELMSKFKHSVRKKQDIQARTYLAEAEHVLADSKDMDRRPFYAVLAVAFVQLKDFVKTKYYQTQTLARPRGGSQSPSPLAMATLSQSFIALGDLDGMKSAFEQMIERASKDEQTLLKIAYVNSLFDVEDNAKASTVLNELYTDAPMTDVERVEVLSLLIVNSLKLGQVQQLDNFYSSLEKIRHAPTPVYQLAKGMYLEYKNSFTSATRQYQYLFEAFKRGKRHIAHLEGVLQFAQLKSKELKQDSAKYLFESLYSSLSPIQKKGPLGVRYQQLWQAHQNRFKQASVLQISRLLQSKDSIYRNELVAVTKELYYKYKIEQDKQKAELVKKEVALEKLTNDKKRQNLWLIISGLTLVIVASVAVIYILFQRRKQAILLHVSEMDRLKQKHKTDIFKKLSATQEQERWRIADQLHDEVGSMLSVVRLNLSENPLKNEMISREKLVTATRVLGDVADTVREMSHQLMPIAIRQYGLVNAIEQLINDINTSGKIYVEHLIYGFDNPSNYPEDFQISFYRIVQELFQNIVKHAKATNAIFQLIEHPDSINLYIEDNGQGMRMGSQKTGKGISLLTHRIDYFDGKISIESQDGKGTLIVIDIPTTHILETKEELAK